MNRSKHEAVGLQLRARAFDSKAVGHDLKHFPLFIKFVLMIEGISHLMKYSTVCLQEFEYFSDIGTKVALGWIFV